MIDFIKIFIKDVELINQFKQDPLLVWNDCRKRLSHFDFETIHTRETKTYKGVLFCFYEHKLEIIFRPHYYFNSNKHNANDFTAQDCINVLSEFVQTFQITDLEQLKIINIEFGLNALSPIDCKDLITYTVYHQRNQFVNDNELLYSKKSYKADKGGRANQYKIIKFYAKGIQFPEHEDINTFRFEIKSKKSRYINLIGVHNLNDLIQFETYQTLKTELLKEFRNVLILGSNNDFKNLNERQKTNLNNYLNTNTWYKILQNHRNQFSQTKKRYFDLLNKTGKNIHKDLENIISNKLELLIVQTCAVSPPIKKIDKSAYSPINIMGNRTLINKRICSITGLNLEREKGEAKYTRTTTLKHLKANDFFRYEILRSKLLSGCFQRPKFEQDEIKHLAKQIRNHYYNPIKNKRIKHDKTLHSNQLVLL